MTEPNEKRCRLLQIESCYDCNHRMEMKELYKPYGMIPVPNGQEITDFIDRWVCTESGDRELKKDYVDGFPDWCPLTMNYRAEIEEIVDLIDGRYESIKNFYETPSDQRTGTDREAFLMYEEVRIIKECVDIILEGTEIGKLRKQQEQLRQQQVRLGTMEERSR